MKEYKVSNLKKLLEVASFSQFKGYYNTELFIAALLHQSSRGVDATHNPGGQDSTVSEGAAISLALHDLFIFNEKNPNSLLLAMPRFPKTKEYYLKDDAKRTDRVNATPIKISDIKTSARPSNPTDNYIYQDQSASGIYWAYKNKKWTKLNKSQVQAEIDEYNVHNLSEDDDIVIENREKFIYLNPNYSPMTAGKAGKASNEIDKHVVRTDDKVYLPFNHGFIQSASQVISWFYNQKPHSEKNDGTTIQTNEDNKLVKEFNDIIEASRSQEGFIPSKIPGIEGYTASVLANGVSYYTKHVFGENQNIRLTLDEVFKTAKDRFLEEGISPSINSINIAKTSMKINMKLTFKFHYEYDDVNYDKLIALKAKNKNYQAYAYFLIDDKMRVYYFKTVSKDKEAKLEENTDYNVIFNVSDLTYLNTSEDVLIKNIEAIKIIPKLGSEGFNCTQVPIDPFIKYFSTDNSLNEQITLDKNTEEQLDSYITKAQAEPNNYGYVNKSKEVEGIAKGLSSLNKTGIDKEAIKKTIASKLNGVSSSNKQDIEKSLNDIVDFGNVK